VPVRYCVMEEAFERGYVKVPKGAPDFAERPGAYLGARWIGPGRGVVDPLKEAEAASMRMENMTSTLEIECAHLGLDYLDVIDQIAIEEAELNERGLSRQSLIASVRDARGPKPDSEEVEQATSPEASESA
jgi:capsid protein